MLTSEEREDLVVSMHPGFVDLIASSRRECPPGAGRSLESVQEELRITTPRKTGKGPVRRRAVAARRTR